MSNLWVTAERSAGSRRRWGRAASAWASRELLAELLDLFGVDGRRRRASPVFLPVRQRLAALRVVAVDRDRLEAELPALEVDLLDLLGRGGLGHVDGLADRAADERLDRAHHPDVAHVVDGPLAVGRLERAVEDRQVLRLEVRRALDGLVLGQVGEDLVDLFRAVAELAQGGRDGLVDDLEEALADELLVLDERDVRLDPGRIAIHHERDRAGRRQDGDLGVAVAELLAELERLVEDGGRAAASRSFGTPLVGIAVGRVAVLGDDPQERLAVLLVALERAAVVAGDDGRLLVRLAVHDRGQGGGVVAALVGVVGETAAHEQRAEVGVAEAERPELVAVLLDPGRRVGRVVDEDLLRGERHLGREAVGLDVELAVSRRRTS